MRIKEEQNHQTLKEENKEFFNTQEEKETRRIKGTGVVQNPAEETSKKTPSRNDETPKPIEQKG